MAFSLVRLVYLLGFFSCIALLLAGRLFYLQILEGSMLTTASLNSRIQEISVDVARGDILDCHGVPLTNTALHFSIVVFPDHVSDASSTARQLAILTNLDQESIITKLKTQRPFKVKTNIDAVMAQKINNARISGVLAVAEKVRYNYTSLASHVVGYTNVADNRGVSGLESMYDDILRGNQSEYLAAFVDAGQQLIPGLGYKRLHVAGQSQSSNILLTIDREIQKIVEAKMDQSIEKGAVVVMRPSTGEIVAMASRPNFDANHLSDYLERNASPLVNRAVSAYQPGSVFKMVLAAAALETKAVRPGDVFTDPGFIYVNNQQFKGWDYDQGGRGRITFTDAIAYSSNPVVIQVALKLGAANLISWSKKLGFGQKTTLNFDGEADGNLPVPDTLYPGDLANLSIGQGSLEASPIQVATMISTIANDGIKPDPLLVKELRSSDGVTIKRYPLTGGSRILSQQTAAALRDMMMAATRYGTGQAAYVEKVGSAGKTGSAETGHYDNKGNSLSHAWFAGYAPLERPEYVIVIFVEKGMSGGDVAAPIFRDIATETLKIK